MKVDPTRAARTDTLKKTSKSGSSGAGFARHLDQDSAPTQSATGVRPTSLVDPLLNADTATESPQQKAQKRGEDMLGMLETLQHGLLFGSLPKDQLKALADLADEDRGDDLDPELSGILDQIELRAKVELAKLERD